MAVRFDDSGSYFSTFLVLTLGSTIVYWLPANQKPENTRIWNSMGGIEFELVTTSLIAVTGGSIDPKPLFHLFIEPKGMELPPALNENLDADVILDANWNLISSPRALAIADSDPDARGFTEETQTLWGKVGGGDPWGGSWGLGMNTNGDWEIDLGFLEFGATQPQTDPGELDFMDFADDTSVHKFGNLKVHKLSLIDFNTWAPDRLTSFNIETMLQLYQPQPQLECTELLEIELTGVVNWRLDETVVKVNYIDEKMYAVIVDSQYIAPNNSCNNYAYTILNSPNRMTQRIAQAHVEKSLTTGDNSLIAPQSAASNSSDENFKNVTVVPFDSNGDGQNDAATVTWDADTNAPQADVFVIAEVQTALETVRYLDGPYTIIGTDNDAHQFNFYSLANNTHYVSVYLLEVNGHTEDRFVAMPTLVSGPGDTGSATLTALTSTITGTTAMIDWRAITTLPQENLSLVLSVMATGDAMQISKAGPYTATNSSEISGQFVFMAPGNGHYAGKLLLLDSNNKVEQEHFIPLTIGVPATTLTGNFTDTPVDKDGNGQPDALQVGAEVTFGEEGEYLLEGSLHDSSGHLMATARTVATKTVGNGQLTLTFDGLTIYHHGQNGPYTVKLALIGPNNIQVAATDNPYTTAAYALGAFGIPQAAIGNTYSASTVDNNGDGLYEELRINVLLNVSTPSTYTLSANLRGTDGDYITSASTSRPLATGAQTVSLVFKGPKLREQQINGPYILDRLTLASTDGQTLDSKRDIFTTSAYQYTTFAPISAQLSNIYSSFAWDTNNNGLYNYLALDVGVAVSVTGKYRLQGSMVTQSGQLIPWASSALYYLSPGNHIVRVPFDGINIQAINSSGTFTVTGVRLLDASNNVLAQRLEAVHTTAAYQYNLFEMGNRSATLDLLHDDMENGSDNWIADPPWRLTIFSSAANYAWSDQPGVHYQNNVNGSLTSVPVSLETLANAALSFRTKYELEPNTDFGYVEISADGGQTWAIIATLTGTSDWHDENISIAPYSGQPRVQVRFRIITNESITAEGWYIDNVKIVEASVLPGPTATPTSVATNTPTAAPSPTNTSLPSDTPTSTVTPLPGDTPTATNSPTSTPTLSPTPTPVPTLLTDAVLYTSSESGGTVSGIAFADEDILSYNTVTGVWALVFDGSDVGIGPDLDALHVESDGTLLLSFDAAVTLAGVGVVENEDLVRFTPTTLGDTTAGSFSWVFDGSDVGLDTTDEDIDALARTPDGKLVLSTAGAFSVDGVSGVGQDLLVFTASSLGETTSGTWALYFDGSDVGLTNANENFWGAEIAANGDLYLTTFATYAVPSLSGDGDDFFACSPFTSGDPTACTFHPYWDGDTYGVGSEYLDALAISAVPLVGAASADRTTAAPVNPIFLPLIRR